MNIMLGFKGGYDGDFDLYFRLPAKHRPECHRELLRAGDVRHHQGADPQAQLDDRLGQARHTSPPSRRAFLTGPLLFSNRQHAVSLHGRFRGRILHHPGGVTRGCGENPLHELGAGALQRGPELRSQHVG